MLETENCTELTQIPQIVAPCEKYAFLAPLLRISEDDILFDGDFGKCVIIYMSSIAWRKIDFLVRKQRLKQQF